MTVLVVGAKGQLGHDMLKKLSARGLNFTAVDVDELDITDPVAVDRAIFADPPSVVINTAAYTAVDKAETEPDLAFAVNRDGCAHLAAACAKSGIPLIHISTDYVFDGTQKNPYREDDPVSPIGVYGRSKAAGDEAIRYLLDEHFIIRTAWLYGQYGHNFVKTILKLGRSHEEIRVVNDQYGCPTNAADLADAISAMALKCVKGRNLTWGTYHYCGEGSTTWHGFATSIIEMAREHESLRVQQVVPIPTEAYPTPAKRPKNSVLDCSRIQEAFGIYPVRWQISLKEVIQRYYNI